MNIPSGDALTRTFVIMNLGAGVCPLTAITPSLAHDLTCHHRTYSHHPIVYYAAVSLPSSKSVFSDTPAC